MKRIFPSLLGFAAGFSLIVFLLLSSVDMSCFRLSFFDEQYRELNTAENLDMSHEDLMNATQTLLDYLRGSRDNIDVEVTVAGVSQPAFNARESAHMVDVRSLYQNAMIVRWGMLVLLLFLTAALFYQKRRQFHAYLSRGILSVSCLFFLFLALIGIWISADFTGFWTSFHKIFFRNDLWLLNPATDLMINLFPEPFFNHLVIRIILWFLAFYIPCLILAFYDQRKELQIFFLPQTVGRKKQKRNQ